MNDDRELEAQLELLLRAARHDHDPSADDRAAVERALSQRLGGEMLRMTAVRSTRSSWLHGSQVWVVATALAVLGATAWFQLQRARESISNRVPALPEQTTPEAPSHTDDASQPQHAPPSAAVDAPSHTKAKLRAPASRRRLPSTLAVPDDISRGQTIEPSSLEAVQPSAATPQHGNVSIGAALAPPSSSANPLPRTAAPIAALRKAQVVDGTEREPQTSELEFMRRVHAALAKAKYRQVLELSAEYAQRWPQGAFEQEREGVRALAACALRLPDSEQNARAYFTRFAHSPLTPRVRATCKLPKTSRSD